MKLCLVPGVVSHICPAEEEMAVYLGLAGTAHVLAGLGYLIVDTCGQGPQTLDTLTAHADSLFETDAETDLAGVMRDTVNQLIGLGILAPCPLTD